MSKIDEAKAKRARRAARNERHPGAFSAVRAKAGTRYGGRAHGDAPAEPSFGSLLRALFKASRRDPKPTRPVLHPVEATGVQLHRGGDR